jgi:hypothetical protein
MDGNVCKESGRTWRELDTLNFGTGDEEEVNTPAQIITPGGSWVPKFTKTCAEGAQNEK